MSSPVVSDSTKITLMTLAMTLISAAVAVLTTTEGNTTAGLVMLFSGCGLAIVYSVLKRTPVKEPA